MIDIVVATLNLMTLTTSTITTRPSLVDLVNTKFELSDRLSL